MPERIVQNDPRYPLNLLDSSRPRGTFRNTNQAIDRTEKGIPTELYMEGQLLNEEKTAHLAVIGSRSVETEARVQQRIKEFLPHLLKLLHHTYPGADFSVVSGMTRGGDALAQQIALGEKLPTVGVLATEITKLHDYGDLKLYHQILTHIRQAMTGTALISEHQQPPKHKGLYYDRNRITVWMSGAVVAYGIDRVTSGAMQAISLAKHAGMPVFYIQDTVTNEVDQVLQKWEAVPVDYPQHIIEWLNHHRNR